MHSWILLLRGVNVGGKHRLPMETLKRALEQAGAGDVRTLLQSGNAVFIAKTKDRASLEREIETAIEAEVGFRPAAVLVTALELRAIIEANPFREFEPAKLAIYFLGSDPGADGWHRVRALKTDPEQLRPGKRSLYAYYPNGMGQSKLAPAALDRALKVVNTARNWNTVNKLLALAED